MRFLILLLMTSKKEQQTALTPLSKNLTGQNFTYK